MELEYKIKTSAELAGAEAAADSLERQIGKAKALKQDYSALETQLKTMRGSIDETKAAMAASAAEQDELQRVNKEVANSYHEVTDAEVEAAAKQQESIAATKAEGLGKRELLESIRGLTREFPILGELVRAAFNPIVAGIFGIIEAFNLWNERVKITQELLGGWELPDLTAHSAGVSAAAEEYEKLKTAVAGADEEFAAGATAFERQKTAIGEILAATKKLIEAQKEKAVADLDMKRASGEMTPSEYSARKEIIERGYSDATVKAEINARNQDLAAKEQAAAKIQQESEEAAAKARNIAPSLNDAGFTEQINKARAGAEAAKKQADEFREKEKLANEMSQQEGLDSFTPHNIALDFKYDTTFGATSKPKDQAKLAGDAAKKAEETAAGLETQTRQLEDQKKRRDDFEAEAAKKAADAEKMRLELKDEHDPNKVGSTAWKNNQDTANQKTRDVTSFEKRATGDVERANKDLATVDEIHGKSNQTAGDAAKVSAALKDAHAAVADAAKTISQLAGMGADVAALKTTVAQLKNQIDHH